MNSDDDCRSSAQDAAILMLACGDTDPEFVGMVTCLLDLLSKGRLRVAYEPKEPWVMRTRHNYTATYPDGTVKRTWSASSTDNCVEYNVVNAGPDGGCTMLCSAGPASDIAFGAALLHETCHVKSYENCTEQDANGDWTIVNEREHCQNEHLCYCLELDLLACALQLDTSGEPGFEMSTEERGCVEQRLSDVQGLKQEVAACAATVE